MAAESTTETTRASAASETGQHGFTTQFPRLDSDIGIEEAWSANVKRTYDRVEEEIAAGVKSAQDHLNALRTVQTQQLTNMVTNADNLQKQHLAHRDIATDRTWTQSNELEALLSAKSGVQADAFVVALAEAIRAGMAK